ncbi:unnamed protein product [Moneuplotes crassus]|uniref:Centrosomal protein CEP104 N-terminal domain-containing protein n=1 Tax=Euplotes crassus TaxID=5936 RepID=A0AAD1UIQ3_EUPCR|nr:unnamed protein product [Moneuplotes crassus]
MAEEIGSHDFKNLKLAYRIYRVTSQDQNYPVTELLISDVSQTRGWRSQRFCDYPQELILEFPCKITLNKVNFLFHSSKIPSEIECYSLSNLRELNPTNEDKETGDVKTTDAPGIEEEDKKRKEDEESEKEGKEEVVQEKDQKKKDSSGVKIEENQGEIQTKETDLQPDSEPAKPEEGPKFWFFKCSTNEDTNFTEQEEKSIEISKECRYFLIKIMRCHNNKLNLFNQISIMNISCFGDVSGYEEKYLKGLININPSEAILMNRTLKAMRGQQFDNENDAYKSILSFKKEVPKFKDKNIQLFDSKIASLNWAKEKAAENEDYQEAEKLKQVINKIEKLKSHIRSLEAKKNAYAMEENYEKAKKTKTEINRVVNVVMNINSRGYKLDQTPNTYKIQPKRMFERHQNALNYSVYDETYSKASIFGDKMGALNINQSAANYNESLPQNNLNITENEIMQSNQQRSVKNLKSVLGPKRMGILKYNSNSHSSGNGGYLSETEHSHMITSISDVNSSMNHERFGIPKKQLRVVDPKDEPDSLNQNKSDFLPQIDFKAESAKAQSPFIQKNSDNRVVPGALMRRPIDFSKVMEEINEQGDSKPIIVDEIDPSEIHRAEPYNEYFDKDTVKLLFSKKWQNKEEGFKRITKEFKDLVKQDTESGDSGGQASSFKGKKKECMDLIINCIERGINEKILHVRLQALDFLKTFLEECPVSPMDLQNFENVVGFCVEGLSENNLKLKEKFEGSLKASLSSKSSNYYDILTLILNKLPIKNKAQQKHKSSQLKFVVKALENITPEENSEESKEAQSKEDAFFTQLLDFTTSYIYKEKVFGKDGKEGIEKAFVQIYKRKNYDFIKEQLEALDSSSLHSLARHIPELKASIDEKEEAERKRKEQLVIDTNKRLALLKNERLKRIKNSLSNKPVTAYTSDRKSREDTPKKELRGGSNISRKLSIGASNEKDKEAEKAEKLEKSKKKSKKSHTKTSMELNKSIEAKASKRNPSRNESRNVTPFGSKKDPSNNSKAKLTMSTSRKIKKSSKSRKDLSHEDNLKSINDAYLSKVPWKGKIKCTDCGEKGFKDLRSLTKHHHKSCKAYKKCDRCDKLLKNSDYSLHQSRKCKNKLTLKTEITTKTQEDPPK